MLLQPRVRSTCRAGVAAVEFAVLLPFIMILIVGTWEVGRLVQITQILDNAAREGARQAATGRQTNDQVKIAVCEYMKNAGLADYTSQRNTVVTVTDLNSPGIDVSSAAQLDQLRVTVAIPFTDVEWTTLKLITSANTTLNAEAVWCSARDRDYPNNITAPDGF
jgi:Flp pilus assembly protein TadG